MISGKKKLVAGAITLALPFSSIVFAPTTHAQETANVSTTTTTVDGSKVTVNISATGDRENVEFTLYNGNKEVTSGKTDKNGKVTLTYDGATKEAQSLAVVSEGKTISISNATCKATGGAATTVGQSAVASLAGVDKESLTTDQVDQALADAVTKAVEEGVITSSGEATVTTDETTSPESTSSGVTTEQLSAFTTAADAVGLSEADREAILATVAGEYFLPNISLPNISLPNFNFDFASLLDGVDFSSGNPNLIIKSIGGKLNTLLSPILDNPTIGGLLKLAWNSVGKSLLQMAIAAHPGAAMFSPQIIALADGIINGYGTTTTPATTPVTTTPDTTTPGVDGADTTTVPTTTNTDSTTPNTADTGGATTTPANETKELGQRDLKVTSDSVEFSFNVEGGATVDCELEVKDSAKTSTESSTTSSTTSKTSSTTTSAKTSTSATVAPAADTNSAPKVETGGEVEVGVTAKVLSIFS